jgi:fructose-1,6-bisphosphatase/inositol monophosphatase family enzyme
MCREASGEVFDAVQNRVRDGDVAAAKLIIEQAWGRVPTEEQVMTRAEYDAEFSRSAAAFVDSIKRVLDRFPGANEAVGAEVERQEQRAATGQAGAEK